MPETPDAAPVQVRVPWVVATLSLVTLGLYNVYLVWAWAREINGLVGARRFNPRIVLVVSLLSLGLGAMIYECFFSLELQKLSERQGLDAPSLPPTVIALNVSGFVLTLFGVLAVIGIPLGVAAVVFMQKRINALAERTTHTTTGASADGAPLTF